MLEGVLGFTVKADIDFLAVLLALDFTVDLLEFFGVLQFHEFFANLGDGK